MNDNSRQVDTERLRELAKLRVVLEIPGMQQVQVRRDVTYRTQRGDGLGMDVYYPPNADTRLPAVIFIAGYSDIGAMALVGFKLKDMGCYVSWAQLVGASGLVGITYSSATPPEDAQAVLRFVRENAAELNVDPTRIGIWAASGNGPTALSLLMSADARLRCAVMCNTYMLDLEGDSTVSEMSENFRFAAPNDGKTVADLDAGTPMFVVRSGLDEVPGLNGTLDRFVTSAVELNRPLTLVNLPEAPHSFDTLHDTDESRLVVTQILAFMRSHLTS